MALEPEIIKQLIATFKTELDEKLQIITEGLFALEKNTNNEASKKIIEEIFRAAHNIKGAARSVGVTHVGEIAHQIESIFTAFRDKNITIASDIVTLCLTSVDAMRSAMHSFSENKPLSFDLNHLLEQLKQGKSDNKNSCEPIFLKENTVTNCEYETIRVSLKHINYISTLVEQMQVNKIFIEEQFKSLTNIAEKSKQLSQSSTVSKEQMKELAYSMHKLNKLNHKGINELNLIANALQEEVRMLRLVPAASLLQQLKRFARDLSHELDKRIEFDVKGDHVRLDKLILEGLKDPLIHILRNAIDHGIESQEIRKQNGKPELAHICIEVMEEGSEIVITIKDDGCGINSQTIAQTALNKNIVNQAELVTLNETEIFDLIFRPEFSTKQIITDISGRGIGLDVVRSNLTDLKGSVSYKTQLGEGTTFELRVPLTLSSEMGLTIVSGGQPFVIPVSAVEHVMMIKPQEIYEVEASQIILFNDKPIPLSILSNLLELPGEKLNSLASLPIIVLKKGWDKIALLVEEIIGEREIVIKPLQPPLNSIFCVAGGTLSGTGEVIIVLNPQDLIQHALHGITTSNISLELETEKKPKHHILLVDDSITTRTLEKNILESNDYLVTVAVDGKQAWEILQKQSFSVVISDVEMPNMDGLELTQRIKKSSLLQETPVIIVTSLGNEEQKKRGIEVGANAYIVKQDFKSTELLEIVGQLV